MYEQLFIWTVLTLVPLIPTYVTHRFLESSATYKAAHQGIKLGGAIAAYFILLGTAFYTYNNMFNDPLSDIRQALSGEWSCTGSITESDKEFDPTKSISSSMNIHVNGGNRISLTGHIPSIFLHWQAEEVIVTEKELIYIFNIPIKNSTGITWLSFNRTDGEILGLFGHWVISGEKGKGSLTCFRNNQ